MMHIIALLLLTIASLDASTIAHYKFENSSGDAPLYELTDSSGNAHHGRVLGQELFELTSDVPPYPGVTGAALDLRGRLDYAVIPHHPHFAPTGDWTVEFFIKASLFHQEHGGETNVAGPFWDAVNTNLSYTILAKPNTNQSVALGSGWAFHYVPARGWVVFTISHGQGKVETMIATGDLRDNQWHHIAVVFAATAEYELRVFQDGFRHQGSNIGNVSFAWGDGPIYLGAWARQNGSFTNRDRNFDGFLDELRFSNAALDTSTFVVDFTPFLFSHVSVDAFSAFEIQFQTEAEKVYRIEKANPLGTWSTLGYLLGDGALKSFFHRGDLSSSYRVLEDTAASVTALPFNAFEAIEIRFPTDRGQLYTITGCDAVNCAQEPNQTFVLGDGAKMSHFERTANHTRFFKVERY